jgi:hypothetical protein
MLEHLTRQGVTGRLDLVLVLVDRGVTPAAARTLGRDHDLEVRRVGWDDKQPVFRPIRNAWRVEVAHCSLGRAAGWRSRLRTPPPRRPAGSRSLHRYPRATPVRRTCPTGAQSRSQRVTGGRVSRGPLCRARGPAEPLFPRAVRAMRKARKGRSRSRPAHKEAGEFLSRSAPGVRRLILDMSWVADASLDEGTSAPGRFFRAGDSSRSLERGHGRCGRSHPFG